MAAGQASAVGDWETVSGAPNDEWEDVSGAPEKNTKADAELTEQTNQAAKAGGASGAKPRAMDIEPMSRIGALNPMETLPEYRLAHPEKSEQESKDAAMSMAVPEAVMTVGAMGPIGGISREGVGSYLSNIGRQMLKGAAASEIGGGIGGAIGGEKGRTIGKVAGGLASPLVPESVYADAPFGLGRFILGDEAYARQLALRKATQMGADIEAGVRQAPDEVANAVRQRRAMWLPTQVPNEDAQLQQAIKEGRAARIPARLPAPKEEPDPVALAVRQRRAAWLPMRIPSQPEIPTGARISDPSLSRVGSEGRAATWTNDFVENQAAKGNREAIAQVARRGLRMPENSRYVMGDADFPRATYNPRDVTTFTPEGSPIRQAGRNIILTDEDGNPLSAPKKKP